jgi:hypothetical protein
MDVHTVSRMTTTTNKSVELAHASGTLINAIKRFREAQHGVMFQLTNPSLSFTYEFERSGKEAERCRVELDKAIDAVDLLTFDVIWASRQNEDKSE